MDDLNINFSYEELMDTYYNYEDWYDIQQSILEDMKSELEKMST